MLRITIHKHSVATKLDLEGRLAGPWVEELKCCWERVAGSPRSQVLVDLTGVTFIDPKGKALLAQLWRQGARLHAVGCLTRCIVEEITKADRAGAPCSSRKDKSKRS